MWKRAPILLVAVLGVTAGSCRGDREKDRSDAASTRTDPSRQTEESPAPDAATLAFKRLHSLNEHVLQAAPLARQRSTDEEVRGFAAHLARDHQENDRRLLELAEAHAIDVTLEAPGMRGPGGRTGSVGDRAEPGGERLEAGQTRGTMTRNRGTGVGMSGASSRAEGDRALDGSGSAASRTEGPSDLAALELEHAAARAAIGRLSRAPDADFDAVFLTDVRAGHADALAALERDPLPVVSARALREFVSDSVRMLDAHEREAQRLLRTRFLDRENVRGTENEDGPVR